jgi:hypothetical protein
MDKAPFEVAVLILAVSGFVGWLGGGRKWAFRTIVGVLVLSLLGVIGTLLYVYGTEKAAQHRAHQIHECALAKVVNARCVDIPKSPDLPSGAEECPAYFLFDDSTKEQEESAVASAEQKCTSELDPAQESIHEQIVRYKKEHDVKIADKNSGDVFDHVSEGILKIRLNDKDCASKVRTAYPHAYDDLSDSVLTRKVLAKYPTYCDVTSSTPGVVPAIEGIR